MIDLNKNGKDDIQEIADGIKQFIRDEGTLIGSHIASATAWLQGEAAGIPDAAQQYFSAALAKVKATGGSLGEQVADMLTLLYNDTLHEAVGLGQEASTALKDIKSEVVSAAVGLLATAP
jgi:hypothetical protein